MMSAEREKSFMGKLHKARVLFYLPEGNVFTNGVYASQCLGLARHIVKAGLGECAILQFEPKDSQMSNVGALRRKAARLMRMFCETFSKDAFMEKRELEKGIVIYADLKTRRNISIFRKIGFFWRIAHRVAPIVQDFKPTYVYCRSYQTAFGASYLAKKFGAKLIYSIRGEDVSEKRCAGGFFNYLVSFWVRRSVAQAIQLADHINTVSKTFRSWLKNEYGCEASVTPCCVDERMFEVDDSRNATRLEMGFSESDKILVYCGGIWPWRCADEMVTMMKNMCEKCAGMRVLFIVKNEKSVTDICTNVGFSPDFWRVHGCRPDEVGKYMRSGDVGILLHRGNILDRVCSPIKIGEYLASGLGVIVPGGTGDFSTDALGKAFYCKYDSLEKVDFYIDFIRGVSEDVRAEARGFARTNYTWLANESEIRKMFA